MVQWNQLKKKLNFKLLSIISVSTAIIALVVTIFMAYKGFGVWALVAQNLIVAAIPSLVFWFYVKWRPQLVFSWQSFKGLFSFGFYMFLTHLVNDFAGQIQGLLIGKIYSPSTMGYYSKASGTEKLASKSISQIMTQVTYPLYAEVQDDKAAMINMIKRMTSTIAFFTFPMMFILLLVAKPLFILLYSERWVQSIPYFQVLCIAGLAHCLQSVNLQTIAAIGKSKVMLFWVIVKRTVGITAIVGGLFLFGMKGLLCGAVFNSWFSYFVNIGLVSKHIGYKWTTQLKDLSPIFFVSVLATLIALGLGYVLQLNMYWDGLLKLLVVAVVYLGWSFVFKPESYKYFLTIINPFFDRFRRKKSVNEN